MIVNIREFSTGPTRVDTKGNVLVNPLNAVETRIMRCIENMSFLFFWGRVQCGFSWLTSLRKLTLDHLSQRSRSERGGTNGSTTSAETTASNPEGSIPDVDFLPESLRVDVLFLFSEFAFDEAELKAAHTVAGPIGSRSEFGFCHLCAAGDLEHLAYWIDQDTNHRRI